MIITGHIIVARCRINKTVIYNEEKGTLLYINCSSNGRVALVGICR